MCRFCETEHLRNFCLLANRGSRDTEAHPNATRPGTVHETQPLRRIPELIDVIRIGHTDPGAKHLIIGFLRHQSVEHSALIKLSSHAIPQPRLLFLPG